MNLGFVDRPTVLHEFGHALGLIHEHQSPFKGGFEWDREEVRVGGRVYSARGLFIAYVSL